MSDILSKILRRKAEEIAALRARLSLRELSQRAEDAEPARGFTAALKKVDLSVAFSLKEDETASVTTIAAAAPHYLESWNDAEIKKGYFSIGQPAISRIFNTRQMQDSFLVWSGATTDYLSVVKEYWKSVLYPLQTREVDFEI